MSEKMSDADRAAFEAWYASERKNAANHMEWDDWRDLDPDERDNYFAAWQAALAYAREGSLPVAWRYLTPTGWHATTQMDKALGASAHHHMQPLYATPPQSTGLTDAVTATIRVIELQLELIKDRAKGDFLDKRPIVQDLRAHQIRLEKALAALQSPSDPGKEDPL